LLAVGGNLIVSSVGSFNQTGGSSNISGSVTNSGRFIQTGSLQIQGNFTNSGTAVLGGSAAWSPGSIFTNTAGTSTFQTDACSSAATLSVNVSGGSVTFASTEHLTSLYVATGATAQLINPAPGNRSVIVTPSLSVSGLLDITSNALVVQGGDLAAITGLVKQGDGGGSWNGSSGITSTSAAADSTHLTALGVIQNNQSGAALFNGSNPFEGTTPGIADILVKLTYYGDANLNGKVDGSDYSLIDNGCQKQLTGWFNGDFNYDNIINGSDYTLIDNAFNTQGTQITAEQATPTAQLAGNAGTSDVPEPAAIGWLGIGTMCLLGRRKRLAGSRTI
jgi:hypothetical protein